MHALYPIHPQLFDIPSADNDFEARLAALGKLVESSKAAHVRLVDHVVCRVRREWTDGALP